MTDAVTKKLDKFQNFINKAKESGLDGLSASVNFKYLQALINVARAAHAFMEAADFGKDEDKRIGELADALKELGEM